MRSFNHSRTYLWTEDGAARPLVVVAPRDGDYHIRARPREAGQAGYYTVSFRLHPWNNLAGPPLPGVP